MKKLSEMTIKEWADAPIVPFDRMEEFKARIEPLMDRVYNICEELGIPFVAIFTLTISEEAHQNCMIRHLTEEAGRVTPEVAAASMLEQLNPEVICALSDMFETTVEKYVGRQFDVVESEFRNIPKEH